MNKKILILISALILLSSLFGCSEEKGEMIVQDKEIIDTFTPKQIVDEQGLSPVDITRILEGTPPGTSIYITLKLEKEKLSIIKIKTSNSVFNTNKGSSTSTFYDYRWQLLDEDDNEIISKVIKKLIDEYYDPALNGTTEETIVPEDPNEIVHISSISSQYEIYESIPYYPNAKTLRLQRFEDGEYKTIDEVLLKE